MKRLEPEEISRIEYFGRADIEGHEYRHKDYLYKSEIYRDGALYARIDNSKAADDPGRIEYV